MEEKLASFEGDEHKKKWNGMSHQGAAGRYWERCGEKAQNLSHLAYISIFSF